MCIFIFTIPSNIGFVITVFCCFHYIFIDLYALTISMYYYLECEDGRSSWHSIYHDFVIHRYKYTKIAFPSAYYEQASITILSLTML